MAQTRTRGRGRVARGSGSMGETPTGAQSCRVGGRGQKQEGGVGQKLRVDFTDLIVWQLEKGRAKEKGRAGRARERERKEYREEERGKEEERQI